ncbi:hypothetical protein LTR70_005508 [Exophiala xenobiotica]|uniref:F-box domain-containing protein n=1 Tax=Lithohypha guttulata TaxID=1690604 RepID=A0ABR0KDT6_9EURO|nr:hypothetical protein LTR24_003875 [Lithohypha guttulata]KAK5318365.1 hypothetical protein LTR70_005508 [Exophiala xenobiotica]
MPILNLGFTLLCLSWERAQLINSTAEMRPPDEESQSHGRYSKKRERVCAHAQEAASWVFQHVAIPLLGSVCLCACCAFALVTRKNMVCGTRKQTPYKSKQKREPQIVYFGDESRFVNEDDMEFDQRRSAADNPKVIVPTTTSYPDLATANERQPFRFLDLPQDIQLMILDMLILRHKDNHWVARANYCRDGFRFYRKPAYVDHFTGRRLRCEGHDPVLVTKKKYLVCPTNHNITTRSLLLTSKPIRELTEQARGLSFSGTLRFEGPEPGSQLAEGWGWYGLALGSPILTLHMWFLKRVRVLETPYYREVWMDAPRIMPSLAPYPVLPHNSWLWTLRVEKLMGAEMTSIAGSRKESSIDK